MDKLLEILRDIHPDIDFETETALVDDGILVSMDIITLVTMIDLEFGVALPVEDLVPENFNSAEALWELIESQLDE